jgi:2,4-dienoyl-CoA reductase (NADPH2)
VSLDHVLAPGTVGGLRLPHRIVMGAMHLGLESTADGGAALGAFYAERARHGAGLMVTGGVAVDERAAGGPAYAVISRAADRERLGRVAADAHAAGGLIAMQLFHAGRYRPEDESGLPVAPSPVYSRFSGCEPRALTDGEIGETIAAFGRAANYAAELGYDAVEIMGSEGYLIDQFLSPLTNRRDDGWGGDPERRRRFGVDVLAAVRAGAHGIPVVFRLTGADLMEGGTPPDEVAAFARALAAGGADAINVGVGWHEAPVPTVQAVVAPGSWAPVAAGIKAVVGDVPVMASNRVNRLEQAEEILATTALDYVSMARPFLADPALMESARRPAVINMCVACNQACIDRSLVDAAVSCMVNPAAGHEWEPIATPRPRARVAVIGGGPAGLAAARRFAARGARVDLFEAGGAIGGLFLLACRVPGKEDYAATVAFYAAELQRLGATVHLDHPVTGADVAALAAYDHIIVASGVHPRIVTIEGAELPHVVAYPDAFAAGALGGRVVIIGGGGVAVDLAHFASAAGRQVTVLHRGRRTAPGLARSTRWVVLGELRRHGVVTHPGVAYRRITPEGVWITDGEGSEHLVPADTVVIAAGQARDTTVTDLLTGAGLAHRVVGGARETAELDAVRAFAEGWEAGGVEA